MSKKVKVVSVILMIIAILFTVSTMVFGSGLVSQLTPNGQVSGQDQFLKLGKQIVGILQVIGAIVAVVVLTVLGIKYMMGSAEEKAEYKKTMIPYVIGAVLVFAATSIANVVVNFATGMSSTIGG